MRVAVVGGGGLGRAMAAFLAKAGHDVTLLFRTREDADRVGSTGLQVSGVDAFERRVSTESGNLDGAYDLVILAVKTYDTDRALERLARADVRLVISAQNGLRKNELLTAWAPGKVLGAVIQITASRSGPTGVHVAAVEPSFVGELDGTVSSRATALARHLTEADIPTRSVANVTALQWTKLASWIPSSLLSLATRLPLPTIYEDPELAQVYVDIAAEVAAVAGRHGQPMIRQGDLVAADLVSPDRTVAVAALRSMAVPLRASGGAGYKASMLLDLLAGRQLELEDTVGHVLELAERSGVDAPVTRSLAHLARSATRVPAGVA